MVKGIIYVYSSPSGKCYIGQTTNESLRRKKWFNMSSPYTSCDWKSKIDKARIKYGPHAFTYRVLFSGTYTSRRIAKHELNILEAYYIGLYNSFKCGYNSTIGGDAPTGPKHHSEETKLKLRKAHLGRKVSNETRQKLSQALTGIKRTQEFKLKAKLAHKGQIRTEQSIQKQIQSQYKKVAMLDINGNIIKVFPSMGEAALSLNKTLGSISIACKRGTLCGGHKWIKV